MPSVLDDLGDSIPEVDGHEGVLAIKLVLLLRHVLGLYLLVPIAMELQDPAIVLGLDHAVRELPMEELGPLGETQMSLRPHVFGVQQIVLFIGLHGCQGDSLGAMQPAWVELRWLNALPGHLALLLLDEMVADHPFDLLVRQLQKICDGPHGEDGFRAEHGRLGAISQEQYLANKELSTVFIGDEFHINLLFLFEELE